MVRLSLVKTIIKPEVADYRFALCAAGLGLLCQQHDGTMEFRTKSGHIAKRYNPKNIKCLIPKDIQLG